VISVRGIHNNEYWTFVFIYILQDNKVQRIYEYQALKGWDIADAIWSPDGRYFAFVPEDVAFGDDGQLWIITRDGSEKRQFRAQYIKDWSPDSKKIYFGIKDYCGFINVDSWSKGDCE
jgi:dipeptidyl aminopeptidase/acylaminoacyl peptidase